MSKNWLQSYVYDGTHGHADEDLYEMIYEKGEQENKERKLSIKDKKEKKKKFAKN